MNVCAAEFIVCSPLQIWYNLIYGLLVLIIIIMSKYQSSALQNCIFVFCFDISWLISSKTSTNCNLQLQFGVFYKRAGLRLEEKEKNNQHSWCLWDCSLSTTVLHDRIIEAQNSCRVLTQRALINYLDKLTELLVLVMWSVSCYLIKSLQWADVFFFSISF